jgi:biotin operon repressor
MSVESDVLLLLSSPTAGDYTIDDLRRALRVTRRDIEAAVESLRLAGQPIIAGNDGLRLTEDPAELAAYVEARRRRLVSIYKGNRSLRQTVRRLQEQRDLTLFGDAA